MPSLYDIATEYLSALEAGFEDGADIEATLGEIARPFTEKAEAVVHYMKNLEGFAGSCSEEESKLAEKRRAAQARSDRLRQYLTDMMKRTGLENVEAGVWKLRIQANPPRVDIFDMKALPADFFTTPDPVPDKKRIADAVKAGEAVPGVELVRGESLRIR